MKVEFCRPTIEEEDIRRAVEVLRGIMLTTGAVVAEFEDYLKEVEAGNFESLYDPRLAITSGPGFQPVKQLAGDDG